MNHKRTKVEKIFERKPERCRYVGCRAPLIFTAHFQKTEFSVMDNLEEGDGFDEIVKIGARQSPEEEFVAAGGQLPSVNQIGPGSPVSGPPVCKLDDEYWDDHLSRDERPVVIRKAKAGDAEAGDRLYRCFHKALKKIAGNIKYRGPAFEEKMSAARLGICNALARYNDNHHNGFWAYARKFVEGSVVDCVHNWHRRGGKGETRAERKDRSGHRRIHIQYNSIENLFDAESGERIEGWIAAGESREWDESGTQLRLSRRLARIEFRLDVPRECIGTDENPYRNGGRYPKKIIGSPGFQIPFARKHSTPARRKIDAPRRGYAPALGIIGYLAQAADCRAMRRLKAMGRRTYALRLWRRDIKPVKLLLHAGYGFGFESSPEYPDGSRCYWRKDVAPNFRPTEMQMAYSLPINTAATASDSKDWKSHENRMADAEKKHPPQVWNEKIKGVWQTIDLRPKIEIYQANAAKAAGRSNGHDRIRQNPGHEACGVPVEIAEATREAARQDTASMSDILRRGFAGGAEAARFSQS
jgi:hypothetical protein